MKKLFLLMTFLFITCVIFAQSFTLTDTLQNDVTNGTMSLIADSLTQPSLHAYILVTNNNDNSLVVKAKKIYLDIVVGSSNVFCWGGLCFTPTTFVSPNSYTLGTGETADDPDWLHPIYYPIENTGTSIIRYVVFDEANPDDSAFVDIYYEVGVGIEENVLTQDYISSLYPNPANDHVSFDYELLDDSDAYISVYDIVGKEIIKRDMTYKEGTIRINTNNLLTGFYYYSFFINNENVRTSRLMIAH